ncbi:MAG: ribbon-helix-helix protein, CopG family [Desulfuromonadaceae bacterium]
MKRKYKEITKDTIVSARISDDEMHNVRLLMEATNLSASEIMRKAFHLQVERFNEAGALSSSCL